MSRDSPQAVAAALEAAGFVVAGRGRGYVRYTWPGPYDRHRPTMIVPLVIRCESDAAELAQTVHFLRQAAAAGEAARRVLDALTPPGETR